MNYWGQVDGDVDWWVTQMTAQPKLALNRELYDWLVLRVAPVATADDIRLLADIEVQS